MLTNITQPLKIVILAIVISIGLNYAYAAWSNPTDTPPNGNIEVPINVGAILQTKNGSLWANFLASSGSGYFAGNMTVDGQVRVPTLCLSGDCRSVWPVGGGGGGSVTSITAGPGLIAVPNPISTTGTISVDNSQTQKRVTGSCPTGAISSIDSAGNVSCQQNIVKHSGTDFCGGTAFLGADFLSNIRSNFQWCSAVSTWAVTCSPFLGFPAAWVLCTQ